MTIEEAIRILDPETTAEALAEIEYYGGFRGEEAVSKAVANARTGHMRDYKRFVTTYAMQGGVGHGKG